MTPYEWLVLAMESVKATDGEMTVKAMGDGLLQISKSHPAFREARRGPGHKVTEHYTQTHAVLLTVDEARWLQAQLARILDTPIQ